jgi:hypothetical protein
MRHVRVCICCALMACILLMCTTKMDWMRHAQTFKIESDGSLSSVAATWTSGALEHPTRVVCPDDDQVYLSEYSSCLRVCRPDQEYDIANNKCVCPENSTLTSTGECVPTCDPFTPTFEMFRLKLYDESTNTCKYAFDAPQHPSTYMLEKKHFKIDPKYYDALGEGGDCLTDPLCDATLDGGLKVALKPDVYDKIGWSRDLDSSTEFKIRA